MQILSPILWVTFFTLLILSFNAHNGLEMFTPGKTEVQRGCVFCLMLHWIICVMLKHSVMVTGRISHLPPHLIQQPWSCLCCRRGNWKGWVLPRVTLGSVAEFDLTPEDESRMGVRQLGVESWCCHLLTDSWQVSFFAWRLHCPQVWNGASWGCCAGAWVPRMGLIIATLNFRHQALGHSHFWGPKDTWNWTWRINFNLSWGGGSS